MSTSRFWTEHYPDGVPERIDIEETTIAENLTQAAAEFGDRAALVFMGQPISYRQLDALVNRCVRALASTGVDQGTRVAIMLPNVPQFVVVNYALLRMGAVAVMVNPLYTERELAYILKDAGVDTLVVLDQLYPRAEAVRDEAGLRQCVVCHVNDLLGIPAAALPPEVYTEVTPRSDDRFLDELVMAQDADPVACRARWTELAVLIYTGGTTGESKGVMLTHENLSASVQMTIAYTGFAQQRGEESTLAIYPFFHVAGFTVVQNASIRNGCTLVLVPRPTPQGVVSLMEAHQPTIVQAVPTLFVGMLALPEFHQIDLSALRQFGTGAAPMSGDTFEALRERCPGVPVTEGYGLTECAGLACATPTILRYKPGSVGPPLPNADIRIVDIETGTREMPVGSEGEILLRGPHVMAGYYNKPEQTAEALRDGWLHTGDIGCLDDEGWLFIKDRKKDLILASGYNVYPREVDDVLFEHPAILEACVVGVPDQYRGETVKAFVVLRPGETLSAEEVREHCRARLAAYKVPAAVEFLAELPKSPVGKILRRSLRE